jgi:hypothetical protein
MYTLIKRDGSDGGDDGLVLGMRKSPLFRSSTGFTFEVAYLASTDSLDSSSQIRRFHRMRNRRCLVRGAPRLVLSMVLQAATRKAEEMGGSTAIWL